MTQSVGTVPYTILCLVLTWVSLNLSAVDKAGKSCTCNSRFPNPTPWNKSTKQLFQIVFSPTLEQIYAMSKNILPELVICLKPFPRLMDKFHLQQRVRKIPFASVIEADHECRKLQMEIERGRPFYVLSYFL